MADDKSTTLDSDVRALAERIKASGVYEDSGAYFVGHRKGQGISTHDVEALARAYLSAEQRAAAAEAAIASWKHEYAPSGADVCCGFSESLLLVTIRDAWGIEARTITDAREALRGREVDLYELCRRRGVGLKRVDAVIDVLAGSGVRFIQSAEYLRWRRSVSPLWKRGDGGNTGPKRPDAPTEVPAASLGEAMSRSPQ